MSYDPLYRKLDILDSKCSTLLQLSSLVLALNVIPVAIVEQSRLALALTVVVAVPFLFSSLLALSVIWVDWAPTQRTVVVRTRTYLIALVATALGVIAMTARIALGLVP
ncbi:MAG: hypothetical protein M3276_08790 [Actinomycetota bacterium]|nr:hypothetical protein [Actinomycetota bacterium]